MNIPVYRGHVRQRGYGLGGTLKSIGSNILPYVVENLSGNLIKEVTEGVDDLIKTPNFFKSVAKKRGMNIGKHIASTIFDDLKSKKLLNMLTGKKTKDKIEDIEDDIEESINDINDLDTAQSGSGRRKRRFNKVKNYKKYNKKRNLDYFD